MRQPTSTFLFRAYQEVCVSSSPKPGGTWIGEPTYTDFLTGCLFAASLLCTLACGGINPFAPQPASLGYSAPTMPVVNGDALPLSLAVKDKNGTVIPGKPVTATVTPPDIAVVTSTGELRCLQSGDATVTLAHEALTTSFPLQCRLVATLGVPPSLRINLGTQVPLPAEPKDSQGRTVADVPLTASSSDTEVLVVNKGKLTPMIVGKARLKVEGAGHSEETEVSVVRQYITESLALRDGEGMTWALPAGSYELEIQVKANDGTAGGVTATWMGVDCPGAPESPDIKQVCKVERAASLVVQNPTTFGMGPQMLGFLNVYQIP